MDRPSGRVIRRYERDRPGELIHVDIKKLGKIPDGGGWKVHGRQIGKKNSDNVGGIGSHRAGYGFIHSAVDDHSRLAYSEILTDERKETAVAFWARAQAWFADHGIKVQEVLTDNGSCYKSRLFAAALGDAKHRRTRPYRPQTNGKVERFNRTMLEEWAYVKPYASEEERRTRLQCLLASLQSPPQPHRPWGQDPNQPCQQPGWSLHLDPPSPRRSIKRKGPLDPGHH